MMSESGILYQAQTRQNLGINTMNQYSFLSENKPISEIVKDESWQRTRSALVGQWKKDPLKCCAALSTWLGPVGQATDDQLRIMWNYLCSSGFRIGKIQHPCINQIRQSVRGEIIKRKIKFR